MSHVGARFESEIYALLDRVKQRLQGVSVPGQIVYGTVLSGDQYGLPVAKLFRSVNCATFCPSESLIYISGEPPRLDANAMRLPTPPAHRRS